MVHVNLTRPLCGLFPGLIAGDSISPDEQEVSGKEGQSVKLKCSYNTSYGYLLSFSGTDIVLTRLLSLYSGKEQDQGVIKEYS